MPIAIGFKIFYGPEADEDTSEVIEQVPEVSTIEDKVVVVTEVPGVAPENIKMGMTGRTLQIFAEEERPAVPHDGAAAAVRPRLGQDAAQARDPRGRARRGRAGLRARRPPLTFS